MANQDNTTNTTNNSKMQLSLVSYLIIIIIMLFSSMGSMVIYSQYFAPSAVDNTSTIASNIKVLSSKLEEITTVVQQNAANVKLQDRLEPELVNEFGNDSEFLNNVAELKKQIIKRRLESEVIKLENEKIARDNNDNNSTAVISTDKETARNIFDILMINATNQTAVVQIQEDIIPVKVGDNIRGYEIKSITNDNVTMTGSEGEREILTLNYLTRPIYGQDAPNGEQNATNEPN